MNLKDIAKLAGVSAVTVSNVINGNHKKVSKETIERVEKIIKENNYYPNATARSLASKESKIIGVVLPYVGADEAFSQSPYYAQILALLENYIRKQGYYMMIRCTGGCNEVIPLFKTWNVDGMIFLGADKSEVGDICKELHVPFVFIDTYGEDYDFTNIGIDDYKGGYLATRYLMGKGHKKIAYAGPSINSEGVIKERYRGFVKAHNEKKIKVTDKQIFETATSYKSGVEIGKKIAFSDEKFTAVCAMSDVLAFGIMEGLRLSGFNIPEDISIIGFDGLPECMYSYPHLTSVSQNLEQKAFLAGKYLFEMIEKKSRLIVKEVVDVDILEGQSVKNILS